MRTFRKTSPALGLVASLALACPALATPVAAQEGTAASVHLSNIMESWDGAPDGEGLMSLAISESQVAARHSNLAAASMDDLDAMKAHAAHVLHALDPSLVSDGPGEGYGLVQAAADIGSQIRLADFADGASETIRNHQEAVARSADNVATWAGEMVGLSREIEKATSASEAAPIARRLWTVSIQIISGTDLDDDKEILWQRGEGGIVHVQQHMSMMMRESEQHLDPHGDAPIFEP